MSKKVLICDDEEGIRESLKLILGDQYDLILTDSSQKCVEAVSSRDDIGLVLLDIKMPQVNGFETLKKIKDIKPELPAIMVTGYKSVETATEAVNLGAVDYIVKPFESDVILEKVAKNLK